MRIRSPERAPAPLCTSTPEDAARQPQSRDGRSGVDLNRIGTTAFFARLIQTNDPDLPYYGLNHLTARGVDVIAQWARTHDATTGVELPASAAGRITPEARALMGAILEHQEYPSWFGQGTIPKIRALFDLNEAHLPGPPPGVRVTRPEAGCALPEVPTRWSVEALTELPVDELPELFAAELEAHQAEINGRGKDGSAGGRIALALLKTYTDALWSRGQHLQVEQVGHALLDVLERYVRGGSEVFQDFNGAGWSAAQSLVLGLDVNEFPRHFPDAMPSEHYTYLYFDGKLAEPMRHVDAYRTALGLEPGARDLEQRSMLGFMINETSGHTKAADVLEERAPFSTSGLNWGRLLFPGDETIAGLPPREGFEFPIDCLSSREDLVIASPRADVLRAQDRWGRPLVAEKVVHRSSSGTPESWSARFWDGAGREVPPTEVVGRIHTSDGFVLGDGRVDLEKDLKWWGFCDINTAQRLYKTVYAVPELDREIVPVRAGKKIVEIPRSDAQRLFDCSLSDLPSRESYCGFRFDDRPVTLKRFDGQTVEGRIPGLDLRNTRSSRRLEGDTIEVPNTPRRTTLGPVAVDGRITVEKWGGAVEQVALDAIESVTGHTEDDVRPSQYMAWISRHGGVFATDSAVGPPVSNGIRWVNAIDIEARTDAEVPSWAQRQLQGRALSGLSGEVVRERGDRMLWVRGMYGGRDQVEARASGDPESLHVQFGAWVQVNRRGRIINEGFISGQPDFGWSAEGPLDWSRPSSFNPHLEPDFRLQLLVNGLRDVEKIEAIAPRLNLPPNWRALRVEDGELAGREGPSSLSAS